MIRFDFDDRYRDDPAVRTMPWFARVVVADLWLLAFLGIVVVPWLIILALLLPDPTAEPAVAETAEEPPLVFLQPSEIPRELLRERPSVNPGPEPAPVPEPEIVLPGNTRPFVEGPPPTPEPAPEPPAPEPTPAPAAVAPPPPPPPIARNEPPPDLRPPAPREDGVLGRLPREGPLRGAIREFSRRAESQTFTNPLGGATDPNAAIQFDDKGVDFGPWLRRFVSQVRNNWLIPQAAMTFRGRVVLQFVIHRDGRITDLHVAQPSDIGAFNRAAANAILGSNPTEPLPAAFPDATAPFTVTFFYNEQPGS